MKKILWIIFTLLNQVINLLYFTYYLLIDGRKKPLKKSVDMRPHMGKVKSQVNKFLNKII